jgi:hypothetical protein
VENSVHLTRILRAVRRIRGVVKVERREAKTGTGPDDT